jgi:hypothetical protein
VVNGQTRLYDASWYATKNAAARLAGLQSTSMPTGVAIIGFDTEGTLDGAIPAGDPRQVAILNLELAHGSLTTPLVIAHQFALIKA